MSDTTNVVNLNQKHNTKTKTVSKKRGRPPKKSNVVVTMPEQNDKTGQKQRGRPSKKGTCENALKDALNKESKLEAFYKKYPWVVTGSVKVVDRGTVVDGVVSKGRVCQIKCVDTGELRTINTSDAFQTKRTATAQLKHMQSKRRKVNSRPSK